MSEEGGKPTTLVAESARPGLFEAYGVEIEVAIVDAGTLDVAPVCDRLMAAVSGGPASEAERGRLTWSNELALHVLEVKTNGPAPRLAGLAAAFHAGFLDAAQALAGTGARLLPGGVHPWMDPARETRLWPHEYTEVYRTFDRIFGCSGHGWSNLQSTHLNLPFADDEEFGRLHAAVRLVLPLIPALAASSPYMDGRRAADLDARLSAYRGNARRVPSVTGRVVPEPAATRAGYQAEILDPIYRDLAPLDPAGVLRHEWVNARGAIARFDRGTVEVRTIDAQECPAADLAVVAAVTAVVRALAEGPLAARDPEGDPETELLARLHDRVVRDGEETPVDDASYRRILGLPAGARSAGAVWRSLVERFPPTDADPLWSRPLETILERGPLARRMVRAAGETPSPGALRRLAEALCRCLETNEAFVAEG